MEYFESIFQHCKCPIRIFLDLIEFTNGRLDFIQAIVFFFIHWQNSSLMLCTLPRKMLNSWSKHWRHISKVVIIFCEFLCHCRSLLMSDLECIIYMGIKREKKETAKKFILFSVVYSADWYYTMKNLLAQLRLMFLN